MKKLKQLTVVGLIGAMMLNLTACNLTINGKEVFSSKKEIIEQNEIEQNETESNKKENKPTEDSKSDTNNDMDGRELLSNAFKKLQSGDYTYVLESYIADEERLPDTVISLSMYSRNLVVNTRDEDNYTLSCSLTTAINKNADNTENAGITVYTVEDDVWIGDTVTSDGDGSVERYSFGSGNDDFTTLLLGDLVSDNFQVDNIETDMSSIVLNAEYNSNSYIISLDAIDKRLKSLEVGDTQTGGEVLSDKYRFYYSDEDTFNNYYDEITQAVEEYRGQINIDGLFNTQEVNTNTVEESKDIEENTSIKDETVNKSVSKSENAILAEEEIDGYLGRKVKDFKYEHCSYDFAEVGEVYKPNEKTKIKLTYSNFNGGETEKLYKTLTLENKTNESQGITEMTVISID